ncbi:alpha/beta hydrolase [Streptomyces sp. NBC_01408]|uniref:alpha/beta hydrolase n=1 Tax=Streptomyces sp. NBC_01408 TaxID=2903855 RepID=UPI002250CF6F|nr:alpha/beta fold hydrolase [Streptomyces sp. NBC_01408]MCX4693198.1 lysophospholipase [Streptomyces sp. NBC_01408]
MLSYLVYHPPRRPHHKHPSDFGLPVEEVSVPLPGGSRSLHVWLCRGGTDRVVVVGHGIGLSKSASLAQAAFLHQEGYTVALFDHRNHGLSDADKAFWGLSERHTDDVVAVVEHLRGMPEYQEAQYAVFGFSFSTFPSLYLLRRAGCPVDAIICDSGPALELRPLFENFLRAKGLPVPGPLRGGPSWSVLTSVFARLGTAMLQAQWPPPAEGAYLSTPVLVLAGEDDSIIPVEGVRALAARYPRAEVEVLPGTEHLQGMKTDPDRYRTAVLDFLKRALG